MSTPSVTQTTPGSYYPRTEIIYGLKWNDGTVTITTGLTATEAIKLFMNSLKLARVGVYSKKIHAVGVVQSNRYKPSSMQTEWTIGDWTKYEMTREDMLALYRAG